MRANIIMITNILGSPVIAKIPRTERTHKASNTEAIILNVRGKIPIAQATAMNIRISHKVTG